MNESEKGFAWLFTGGIVATSAYLAATYWIHSTPVATMNEDDSTAAPDFSMLEKTGHDEPALVQTKTKAPKIEPKRGPAEAESSKTLPARDQHASSPKALERPQVRVGAIRATHRLEEFARFEGQPRLDLSGFNIPELSGWSQLLGLSYTEAEAGTEAMRFKGLRFRSANDTGSTLQRFNGPIAIISEKTKKVAVITGRISVVHRGNVDPNQFANDHGLRVEASPENSISATYTVAGNGESLANARHSIVSDRRRVREAEIEIITGKLRK